MNAQQMERLLRLGYQVMLRTNPNNPSWHVKILNGILQTQYISSDGNHLQPWVQPWVSVSQDNLIEKISRYTQQYSVTATQENK